MKTKIRNCIVGTSGINSPYGIEINVGTRRMDMKQGAYLRLTKEGLVYPTRNIYLKRKRGRPKKHKKIITFIGVFLDYE